LKIVNSQHKLSEFTDRKNFKSYDELKKKLNEVLSGDSFAPKSAAEIADEPRSAPAPAFTAKAAPQPKSSVSNQDDDEDVMSYFQKIANDE
jgi:hypothetical protein